MISVAFAQIRAHWARFAAIGLGIALAAGFVSATLIINTSLQESLREGIGQSFSRAGVVVMPVTGAAIDPPEVAAVTESLAGVPGVSAVEVTASAVASARGGGIADPRVDALDRSLGDRQVAGALSGERRRGLVEIEHPRVDDDGGRRAVDLRRGGDRVVRDPQGLLQQPEAGDDDTDHHENHSQCVTHAGTFSSTREYPCPPVWADDSTSLGH